jgi:ABC-type transport system involved in multi-copper enzyme maturation permease subunit
VPLYEAGYRTYMGPRPEPRFRFLPIVRMELRELWRLKRLRLPFIAAFTPCLVYVMLLYLRSVRQVPYDEPLHLEFYAKYFTQPWNWICLLLITTAYGTGLVARDLKSNALDLYFSHPVTGPDYVLGKCLALGAPLLLLTMLPVFTIWGIAAVLEPDWTFLGDTWPWVPRLLGCAALVATVLTIPCVAVSTLSANAWFAGGTWIVLFLFSDVAADLVKQIFRHSRYSWFGLANAIEQTIAALIGVDRPHQFDPELGVGFLAGIFLLSLARLWWFKRKYV